MDLFQGTEDLRENVPGLLYPYPSRTALKLCGQQSGNWGTEAASRLAHTLGEFTAQGTHPI